MQELKRVRWVSIAEPAKTESWLSKMAQQGYFIKKVEKSTFLFEKADPEEMEYRIVYTKGGAVYEQLCYYQELGWNLIQAGKEVLILEARTKDKPSESYFGEEEKQQWRKKDSLSSVISLVAGISFLLWFLKGIFSGQNDNIINYRNINRGYYVLIINLIAIFTLLNIACANYRNRRYIHNTEKHKREAHHIKVHRPVNPELMFSGIGITFGILFLLYGVWTTPGATLAVEQVKQIPWIQEENLEQSGTKKYVDGRAQKLKGTILADTYTYDNYYKENGQQYIGIYQEYYEKNTPWLQKEFLQSILTHSSKIDGSRHVANSEIQELSVEGLDLAYYIPLKERNSYVVAAAYGKRILYAEVYDTSITYENILSQMKENLRS